jgi:hypothetical protein
MTDTQKLYDRHARVDQIARDKYLPRLAFDWAAHQPAGEYGFRTGHWTVLFDDRPMEVFSSVPHEASLETQTRMVLMDAARALAWTEVK